MKLGAIVTPKIQGKPLKEGIKLLFGKNDPKRAKKEERESRSKIEKTALERKRVAASVAGDQYRARQLRVTTMVVPVANIAIEGGTWATRAVERVFLFFENENQFEKGEKKGMSIPNQVLAVAPNYLPITYYDHVLDSQLYGDETLQLFPYRGLTYIHLRM